MKKTENIEKLFREELGSYEAPVNADLWSTISQQVGANTAASGSAGLGIASKLIIAATAIGTIGLISYFVVEGSSTKKTKELHTKNFIEESSDEVKINPESTATDDELVRDEKTLVVTENISSDSEIAQRDNMQKEGGEIKTDISEDPVEETEMVDLDQLVEELKETSIANSKGNSVTEDKKANNGRDSASKSSAENETPVIDEATNDEILVHHKEESATIFSEKLPNIITPNGDGDNDFLVIKAKERLSYFKIEIYDLRGRVVFRSEDPDFRWNGTLPDGEPAPAGRYVYQIEVRAGMNNSGKPFVQSLEIVR